MAIGVAVQQHELAADSREPDIDRLVAPVALTQFVVASERGYIVSSAIPPIGKSPDLVARSDSVERPLRRCDTENAEDPSRGSVLDF
jgi:hypothetical protein